jgi:type IV secretion system protein VirB11
VQEFAALETYLIPLKRIFGQEGVAEVMINEPGEAWIEKKGDFERVELPEFDFDHLRGLARLVAQSTEQTIY